MNNKILLISACLIKFLMSCNNPKYKPNISDVHFNSIGEHILLSTTDVDNNLSKVKILLMDSTVKEEYYFIEGKLERYTYFDNSSIENEPKFSIHLKDDGKHIVSGKSFYVISKMFNSNQALNIGDTLELIIPAATPIFLENSLFVYRNGFSVLKNYKFEANKDQLVLNYIIKEKGVLNYLLKYELISRKLNLHNIDSISFNILVE